MAPNPAGVVDPEIGVCAFVHCSDSALLALLANVTMHPTTLGVCVHAVSADYPGRVIRQMQASMPDDGVAFLIQGAAGDSRPLLDARATTFREGTERDIDRIGRDLGRCINAIAQNAVPLGAAALRVDHRRLQTGFAEAIREATFGHLLHRSDQTADSQPMPTSDRAAEWNHGHLDQSLLDQERRSWAGRMLQALRTAAPLAEVQLLVLGNAVAWVFLPGEPFAEVGLAIKRRAWTPYTFAAGYCNGTIGYVPTAQEAERGGYETTEAYRLYGLAAALHRNTATQLEDAVIEMLETA